MRPQAVHTNTIAHIWEIESGFIIADWNNELVTCTVFENDADASQYAKAHGFVEIFWMEQD